MKVKYLLVAILAILFFSCSQSELDPVNVDLQESFYPLEIGLYKVYDVAEINYTEFAGNDTSFYQLKEIQADTLRDLVGNLVYRLEIYKRFDPTDDWAIDSVWSAYNDGARIVKVENNTPYIKLIFPFEERKEWDGNILNNEGIFGELFRMDSIGNDFSTLYYEGEFISSTEESIYTNTVQVTEQNSETILSNDFRLEVYKDSVGLVYKKFQNYEHPNDTDNPAYGTDLVVGGRYVEWKLIENGKE